MITYGAIKTILIGNLSYAYRCIFQTREYIERYGFGEGSHWRHDWSVRLLLGLQLF